MEDNEISWGKPSIEELKEHYTTPNICVDPRSVLVQQSSSSSIDLDDSFKAILQERRRQLGYCSPVSRNKEILKTPANRLTFEKTQSMESDQSSWMNCGDDSFLGLEQMCENTLDDESVMKEFDVKDDGKNLMDHLNNMTQLNDIEAPSLIFDQTILNVNLTKPSPIKVNLVHISRPSTIIEESTIDNSSNAENEVKKQLEEITDETPDLDSTKFTFNDQTSLNTTNNESFKTAKASDITIDRTSYKTANDHSLSTIKSTFSDVNVFPIKKKRNFYDASFAQSLSMSNSNSSTSVDSLFNVKYEENSDFLDSLDIIEVSSKENTGQSNEDNLSKENNVLLDDEHNDELLEAPNFNDTLEEMDFIMKHGMKFMEQQKNCSQIGTTEVLKQHNFTTKSISDSDKNKNTPTTFKKPQVISRLPVLKSNSKKFDHIVSPIHAYIKEAPQYPLIAKQKGTTGLIDQLHDPNRRDTVYSINDENLFTDDPFYKPIIPLKGVISTQKHQKYDARTPIKMPGGEKVHKLIGNHTPSVIKHEGRFKSYANVPINANDTVDDSFANLSVASGDVSIQVVKNVNRV